MLVELAMVTLGEIGAALPRMEKSQVGCMSSPFIACATKFVQEHTDSDRLIRHRSFVLVVHERLYRNYFNRFRPQVAKPTRPTPNNIIVDGSGT